MKPCVTRAQVEGRVKAGWVRGNKKIQPIATPRETLCHARTGGGARQGRLGEGQQEDFAGGRQRSRIAALHGARSLNHALHMCLAFCGVLLAWSLKGQVCCRNILQAMHSMLK